MEHTSLYIILLMSAYIYSGHTVTSSLRCETREEGGLQHTTCTSTGEATDHANYMSPVLSVSPARWLNVGDSVTLSCEVEDSSTGWRFYWYKDVYDGQSYSTELLPDSERGAGGSYSVSSVGLNHTGAYSCSAERGLEAYYTDYRDSSAHFLWVAGLSPPASLTVSPNTSQFFETESVSVSCEVQGNSTGWRVMRLPEGKRVRECPSVESSTGPTCTLPWVFTSDSGVYWCESGSGEYSNAVNITVTERPYPVLSVSPAGWLNVGDSVTLSCEVKDSSTGWRFYWYRDVYDGQSYTTELLPDSERGAGGSYSVSSVGLNHTGAYSCRAGRGDPVYYTDYSYNQLLWVAGLSPPASLTISPNTSQFFYGELISVSCEVQGNSTGWRVTESTKRFRLSKCLEAFETSTGPTCLIPSVSTYYNGGMYWCESGSGEYSNAVNITVTDRTSPVLSVSPAWWLNVGDSVTLSCEVEDSPTGWRFYWYKDVYDGQSYSPELLPDSERGAGGSYSVSSVGLNHTGAYSCRAGRGDPVYYTDYSSAHLLWVAGLSPPASLTISPNRSQFFKDESVSVSCEVQGNSTGWRVKTFTQISSVSEFLSVESSTGPTCTLPSVSQYRDGGVIWCESGSGEYSNVVNITVTDGAVILESAALPATEGDAVTLRCRSQGTPPSVLPADFYRDGSFIRAGRTGEMTIPAVSQSDEGFYKCKSSDRGESPESWLAVRAQPDEEKQ